MQDEVVAVAADLVADLAVGDRYPSLQPPGCSLSGEGCPKAGLDKSITDAQSATP